MRRVVSTLLCAATLLSFAACKKEAPNNPAPDSNTPVDLQAYIADAAEKTSTQTNFHMTGSYTATSTTHYDLQVNGFRTENLQAHGSMEHEGTTERFSVEDNSYRYQITASDGSAYGEAKELTQGYEQCETLDICDFIFSIPNSEAVQGAVTKNATVKQHNGTTTVTASLSEQQFMDLYHNKTEAGTVSDITVDISVSDAGYCTGIALAYRMDDVSHQYKFSFNDFGVTQDITPVIITVVNADQWKNALSPSSFENVTVTRYYDDRTKENPSTIMINGAISARSFRRGLASADGTSTNIVGMSYFYQLDGQNYKLEEGTTTAHDGSQTRHYQLTTTERYAGETAGSFASSIEANYGFSEHYDDFRYDAQTGTYTGTSSDDKWDYSYTLSFDNGRLISILCALVDKQTGETKTVNSYHFTDYGTTQIVIPAE